MMTSDDVDDVADGCTSADRNEDFWSARGDNVRNRLTAHDVPTLCVLSVGVSTGSSAYV